MYYIFTSQKNKKVLATKNIAESFDFIKKNRDSKVWTMDHTAKTKILRRTVFIIRYLELTKEQGKAFQMAEIMIKGNNNFVFFLEQNGLKEKYLAYKAIIDKNL